jgi:formylglycine-generating enzyme required for sulfatase activity
VKSADHNSPNSAALSVDSIELATVTIEPTSHSWRDFDWASQMVLLPNGQFAMGENENDKFANDTERPRHLVTISSKVAIGRFPVTAAEFRRFDSTVGKPSDLPMVNVSWTQANDYCAWLAAETGSAYRLPTEAEWEYACRSGNDSPFYRGNELAIDEANYLYDEHGRKIGRGELTPYGCYPRNGFGIADMLGNVCEWVADSWHPNYVGAPSDGSCWCDGTEPAKRIIRGGAWDYLPRLLRCSWRDWLWQTTCRDNVGFRVAATL